MSMLADNEFLFTSESVTEGHPDKIADQISDGVLDAVLRDDPVGRVACETLVNTGLVVVSGEITTTTYVDIQEVARRDDQADRLHGRGVRVRLPHVRGDQRDRQAVAGHRAGGGSGMGSRATDPGDDDELDVAGAGDQGMMFGYASNGDRGADAVADLVGAQAGQAAGGCAAGGDPAVSAAGREDAGDGALRGRAAGRGREGADLDPASRRRRVAAEGRPVGARACEPVVPEELYDAAQAAPGTAGQPDRPVRDRRADGRLRADRAQDHRRHVRGDGPPRRRRVQREGSLEGGSLGRVRRPLCGQECGRGGAGRPARGAGRVRDRGGASGVGDDRDVRDREGRRARGFSS